MANRPTVQELRFRAVKWARTKDHNSSQMAAARHRAEGFEAGYRAALKDIEASSNECLSNDDYAAALTEWTAPLKER